ncbi:unnamed protein product [Medioppia subpectinata]|uniref:Uncharacterized protein n=1 Tax=Medioppia subpectinata TaxID=1979941 RepID=A0A7R9PY60_9ACAR|nr:unnamed protein product [Medioppia subpectinata]CAG2105543.1 unnamed protein product [Medioppia subpectinata]
MILYGTKTLTFNGSNEQLVYGVGDQQIENIFVHFDNQTLDMNGNSDLFICVNKIKDIVIQCTSTIAVQWNVKKLYQLKYNFTEERINGFNYTDIRLVNDTNQYLLFGLTYSEAVCCALNELFDCIEYTVRRECKEDAIEELKQINQLIRAQKPYNCTDSFQKSHKCSTFIRKVTNYILNYGHSSAQSVYTFHILLYHIQSVEIEMGLIVIIDHHCYHCWHPLHCLLPIPLEILWIKIFDICGKHHIKCQSIAAVEECIHIFNTLAINLDKVWFHYKCWHKIAINYGSNDSRMVANLFDTSRKIHNFVAVFIHELKLTPTLFAH